MYRKHAQIYDLIYSNKDYQQDSERVQKFIERYKQSSGNDLLEVACGSGNYLHYLKNQFNCTGIDINEGILNVAKKKVKGVRFLKGNMINFSLHKKFDVIACLFSSIGYVKTYENLHKTITNFYNHLNQGGVVIIEPWISPENFKAGESHLKTYQDENIKIARLDVSQRKGNLSILDFHFVVAERDKNVIHFTDRHELGLFDTPRTLNVMKKIGLESRFIKDKKERYYRGAFIGVKN